MNYPLNRNIRDKKRFGFRPVALFVVALLLFALSLWRPGLIRTPLFALAEPVWRMGNTLGESASRAAQYFKFKQSLVVEIKTLHQKEDEQDALLAGYEMMREENQALKVLLGRGEEEGRILAALLVSPPHAPYDSFVLDAGTEDGAAVGDDVLFGRTVLGRIAAVSRRAATGQLFSSPGVTTSVVIWRDGRALPAEAKGEGNGSFRIVVPKETGVTVGDRVVMPGINPSQFGEVAAVLSDETDSFATALVRNPVNAWSLRFLEIRSR